MANSDQEREQELAELLKEVRALRKTIDELKAGPEPRRGLSPDYDVLVRSQPELRHDYEVLVRTVPPFQPPSYDVLVRPAVEESERSEESKASEASRPAKEPKESEEPPGGGQ
ncbi:hypothetical protein [Streptomyces sp. RerS4]|uniref:hypothetical protein n=1 Tax=Streptomyces sp. RerS4 TaxID=2942449 RepID=UPI00201C7C1D|nr:hypothetical protein [Streptomyces sp. RerS4]UQX04553.1 hypothetical protein M4D82_31600 [Streptomyces sp. RerS4]